MTSHPNEPKRAVLAIMCGVVAMTVLDLSVVNVALPSIQAELSVAAADLQWVVVTYGVAVAGFLLLGGRMGDLAGHRRVLLTGIGLLALASLVAGLADGLGVLVAGRAGQGLGAALAAPNALAILSRTFAEGPERNRALGIFGAAGGTAAIAGSILGGLLVEGPGWEWVFFLNVPLGVLLAGAVLRFVPGDEAAADRDGVDLAGALTLTGGLVAATLGVHASTGSGWIAPRTLGLLAAAAVLLAIFTAVEKRRRSPLIPLSTLRRRSLVAANLAAGLLWASFLALIYHATLFVQQELGYPPLAAGASTIPIAVLSLSVSALVAPRVMNLVGAAATIAGGMALLGVGMLLLARVPSDASYGVDLLPAYIVVGLGLGLAEVAVQVAAFAGVGEDEAGLAGGAVETAREMGGAVGLALVVSIVLSGADGALEAYHRSAVASAVLAALGATVAVILLRPTEATVREGAATRGRSVPK